MTDNQKDFYINEDGNTVFTKEFHLRRGYCCESSCLHCPYGFNERVDDEKSNIPHELRQTPQQNLASDQDMAEYYLKSLTDLDEIE